MADHRGTFDVHDKYIGRKRMSTLPSVQGTVVQVK